MNSRRDELKISDSYTSISSEASGADSAVLFTTVVLNLVVQMLAFNHLPVL